MNKEMAKAELKKIGLNALEDAVKKVVIPYAEVELSKKNETVAMIVSMLKGPVVALSDKIDGEEG